MFTYTNSFLLLIIIICLTVESFKLLESQPQLTTTFSNKYTFVTPMFTHKLNTKLYAKNDNKRQVYNKRDIVSEVGEKLNKTQKEVGQVVDEFLSSIKRHLSNDSEVSLSKFGVFKNSLRGERRMRNLQTGEIFTAKPVHVPTLRFYDTFKAELNDKLKSKDKRNYSSYKY
uniref:Bacterial histone-like protein, putative n=1 Tax=Theileria annulata TaxID=5874 RepID=A0A3B0MUX8_THEAN